VYLERLGDNLPYRHAWIERAIGILEDHLHLSTDRTQRRFSQARERSSLEDDLASRRLFKLQDATAECGLPTPRLPDQSQSLPAGNREADAVHSAHHSHRPGEQTLPRDREVLDQITNL
jgi:hypothetical protein